MTVAPATIALPVQDGNLAQVLQAAAEACRQHLPAALAVVLETDGSTYTRAGTAVLFRTSGHVGWLSGGCLEPEIERRAMAAVEHARIEWLEIDTRDDDALFGGNAVGCRGRQRVALLPLTALAGIEAVFQAWLRGDAPLQLTLHADGRIEAQCEDAATAHHLASAPVPWPAPRTHWSCDWQRAPRVLLLGTGPEAGPLLPALQGLGWRVVLHDPRASWRARSHVGDAAVSAPLSTLLQGPVVPDAALVMHHNFELDLEALLQLAPTAVPFIGLLGPDRRREDLFKLLPSADAEALAPRLRSPIGLALGGRGPEAIALCIAAQLQAWRHGSPLASP